MKVKIYVINGTTTGQYYGLMDAEDNTPCCNAHAWRTYRGAVRWAIKHGYTVVE